MGGRILFGLTIFLSAFLLFQVQPIIGKYILPWFGSAPGVWAVCLVFFQVVLLGGYAYAHLLVRRLRPRRQAVVHIGLLVLALATLPITPGESWKPTPGETPAGQILLLLLVAVGLPYALLSSTGPLLQAWFARSFPGRSVYRLYALSNVGSLLGLLSYPFWFERELGLQGQTVAWSIGYGAFAVLCAACAWLARRPAEDADAWKSTLEPAATGRASARGDGVLWFLLPAVASALLLATTNQMCLDVAVVPFLWVVPLCVYLLSFILTFDHERWYARPFFALLLPLAIGAVVWQLEAGVDAKLRDQLIVFPAALFVLCMCCHGELARIKPAPERLTLFFLVVSLGGAAGGTAVALGAPLWFQSFDEYPLLLIVAVALILVAIARQRPWVASRPYRWPMMFRDALWLGAGAAVVAGLYYAFQDSTWLHEDSQEGVAEELDAWLGKMKVLVPVLPVVAIAWLEIWRPRVAGVRRRLAAGWGGLLLAGTILGAGWMTTKKQYGIIERDRNFYGVLTVREYNRHGRWHDFTLEHGRITHGYQLKRNPTWPVSYYGPRTGIGLAMSLLPARNEEGRPFRIGVVGLGSGTMAVFANNRIDDQAILDSLYVTPKPAPPADYLRFYEINPMVVDFAERHFTFLSDARSRGADVDVFLGDARLVMERQIAQGEQQRFDVLVIDAFSSDAIPIHLLTKESFEIYAQHLSPLGVLAVHVTNRYIDLIPVVKRLGEELGQQVRLVESVRDSPRGVYACDWMLLTRNRVLQVLLRSKAGVVELARPSGPLWTDDYSSVWDHVYFRGHGDDEEEDDE